MTLRERLVREEYVGENRCWPCTVLNAGIVAVAALVLAVVWAPLAVLAVVFGGIAIAYRGYVVPGTPRFAPRVAARLPVSFGHSERAPTRSGSDGATAETDGRGAGAGGDDGENAASDGEAAESDGEAAESDGEAAESDGDAVFDALRDAGVLVGSEADVALDESFRDAWRERMRDVREGDVVAAVRDTRPDAAVERQVDESGDEWVVVGAGGTDETWLAPAVAVADVAAVEALDARGVSREVGLPAASALRAFLERCPSCDGTLAWENEGCCGGYGPDGPNRILACQTCGAAVFAE